MSVGNSRNILVLKPVRLVKSGLEIVSKDYGG